MPLLNILVEAVSVKLCIVSMLMCVGTCVCVCVCMCVCTRTCMRVRAQNCFYGQDFTLLLL